MRFLRRSIEKKSVHTILAAAACRKSGSGSALLSPAHRWRGRSRAWDRSRSTSAASPRLEGDLAQLPKVVGLVRKAASASPAKPAPWLRRHRAHSAGSAARGWPPRRCPAIAPAPGSATASGPAAAAVPAAWPAPARPFRLGGKQVSSPLGDGDKSRTWLAGKLPVRRAASLCS